MQYLGRERKNRWYVAVAAYRDSAGAVMIYGTMCTRINIDRTVLLTYRPGGVSSMNMGSFFNRAEADPAKLQ